MDSQHLSKVFSLPDNFLPRPAKHFQVERIVLTKGSLRTKAREKFCRAICEVYPGATMEERLDSVHNRLSLSGQDPLARLRQGKRTLVLGELDHPVQRYKQRWETDPPDYWYFSVYGHCPYGCKYCWLAGTKGVWHSPTVKIFVNLPEILNQLEQRASKAEKPTGFHLGRFHDGLALDPLTAYSTVLVPFFSRQRYARQIVLTKSDSVERLLHLEHGGHTILTWSLNPPGISSRYEENVPSIKARIRAMQECAEAGYPVRASIEPVIPHGDWENIYADFIRALLSSVPLQRLYFGKLYLCPNALYLTQLRIGKGNLIARSLANDRQKSGIGRERARYYRAVFHELACLARKTQRNVQIGYCSVL